MSESKQKIPHTNTISTVKGFVTLSPQNPTPRPFTKIQFLRYHPHLNNHGSYTEFAKFNKLIVSLPLSLMGFAQTASETLYTMTKAVILNKFSSLEVDHADKLMQNTTLLSEMTPSKLNRYLSQKITAAGWGDNRLRHAWFRQLLQFIHVI